MPAFSFIRNSLFIDRYRCPFDGMRLCIPSDRARIFQDNGESRRVEDNASCHWCGGGR